MMMESRKVVPSFRTITDFEWDVAQLPVHRQPATILHSDAYCMTAASEHKDQAWTFLEFALGTRGPADRDRDRADRALAAVGRRVRRVPRPERAARELAGVPRQHPASSGPCRTIETWPEIEDVVNALLEEAYYEPAGGGEAGELVVAMLDQTKPLFERANEG